MAHEHAAPPPDDRDAPPSSSGPVPPHDLDAETALLGSMMLSRAAIRDALEIGITPTEFYRPQHGWIFDAILDLHARGLGVDPVTVYAELGDRAGDNVGQLSKAQILQIQVAAPASVNARAYAEIIRDRSLRRVLQSAALDLSQAARDGDDTDRHVVRILDQITEQQRPNALQPVDLGPILDGTPPSVKPTIWTRSDGHHLIYPGRLTSFAAEPSAGKTWLALAICAEQLALFQHVIYLDLEADAAAMVERLRALGVTDLAIRDRFHYLRPDRPLAPTDRLALVALVRKHAATVVVIDTLAAMLALHGLNESDAGDVMALLVPLCRPLALADAAVVLLDHVVKDKETRGRWARGSGAKLGEVDAAYGVQTITPFSRLQSGRVRLRLDKDRWGALGTERAPIADIAITVGDQGAVAVTVDPPPDHDPDHPFAPTAAMAAISDFMESVPGIPLAKSRIEEAIKYKRDTTRAALAELIRTGHIVVSLGARNSLQHTLIRPYHEPDETDDDDQYRF